MMKELVFLAALMGLCVANPLNGQERMNVYNPFIGSYPGFLFGRRNFDHGFANIPFVPNPFLNPAGGFAGGFVPTPYFNPYGGFSGAGFMPNTYNNPIQWRNFVPVIPKPWYKGNNVCVERKESLEEWTNDGSFGNTHFEHQSESCRGSDTTHICYSREMTGEGIKMVVTKYACCEGFVRPQDGTPGCVRIADSESIQSE